MRGKTKERRRSGVLGVRRDTITKSNFVLCQTQHIEDMISELPIYQPESNVQLMSQNVTDVFQSLTLEDKQSTDASQSSVSSVSIDIFTPSSIQHFPIDSR